METLIRVRSLTKKSSENTPQRGTYFIQTWGCQMNEEDSEQIGLALQTIGFSPVEDFRSAQVLILNTCSVRKKPEDKAFSFLGTLAEIKRNFPEIVVGVAGCMAQIRPKEIREKAHFVDFVVGTAQVTQIAGLVEETLQKRRFKTRLELPERRGAVVTDIPLRHIGRAPKLKAFVPIQYGCDKFCTYCIVPSTRGRERSRPTEEILAEVEGLVQHGTREVTLLGQTVNSYGKNLAEGRVSFAELLRKIAEIPDLLRIRYTSPYPRDFSDELIHTIRDVKEVMPHMHIPLQSGSDAVLRKMKRIYTADSFLDIVSRMRAAVPNIGMSTDVIVGFPGETEDDFEQTMDMMRKIRFDAAYMFAYSERPGTAAEGILGVSEQEKNRRLNHLIAAQQAITLEINEALGCREFKVLIDGRSRKEPAYLSGHTEEFRLVLVPGGDGLIGSEVVVKVVSGHPWGLLCELS